MRISKSSSVLSSAHIVNTDTVTAGPYQPQRAAETMLTTLREDESKEGEKKRYQLSRCRHVLQAAVATLVTLLNPQPPQSQCTQPCSLMHLSIVACYDWPLHSSCDHLLRTRAAL